MPLPKPSKVISKRRKHPQAVPPCCHPSASPQKPSHRTKLWPHTSLYQWRLRVVCTDPDATDDSSADEVEVKAPNKRHIREIFLPLPHPIAPHSPPPRRRQQHLGHNAFGPYSRKPCCKAEARHAEAEAEEAAARVCIDEEDMHISTQSHQLMTGVDLKSTTAEEELSQILSGLVPGARDHGWRGVIDGGEGTEVRQEDEIAGIPDFDLDVEALAWINSLERLP